MVDYFTLYRAYKTVLLLHLILRCHSMIKYLDTVEWLVCYYDPKSYASRSLSPGSFNLARQVNGCDPDETLVTLRNKPE